MAQSSSRSHDVGGLLTKDASGAQLMDGKSVAQISKLLCSFVPSVGKREPYKNS